MYHKRMIHRIHRKEGPGGLSPAGESIIPYAKTPEELRLLDDVEMRVQDTERIAKEATAGAVALAKGDAIDADIERPDEAEARIETAAFIDKVRDAAYEAKANAEAKDLGYMDAADIERSRPLERALSGEIVPDEVIEMSTPDWIDPKDPEFATQPSRPWHMTEKEEKESMVRERKLAERTATTPQYIELGGEEADIPDLAPIDAPPPRKENESTRERMERVLGSASRAPKKAARLEDTKPGFFARLRGWFR